MVRALDVQKTDKRVFITRPIHGIAHMQVCAVADATDEEILKVCNAENPSGTEHGWCKVLRKDAIPKQRPVRCKDHPERLHLLVVC